MIHNTHLKNEQYENIHKINKDILNKTKKYYKLKSYNIFHQTISLIISQKISFTESRKIRQNIFNMISPEEEFTKENISDILDKINIDQNKCNTILAVIKIDQCDTNTWIENISKIKGIGPWTIKCLKIMFDTDDDIFLFEDLWIRKRLSELVSSSTVMSQSECQKISSKWNGYKTTVSKFLWRIKPEGIQSLKNDEALEKIHFL